MKAEGTVRVAAGSPKRRARARQVRAALAGLLLLPGATGCYTYVPLWNGNPAPGSEITLGLSDRGRAALAGPLGPGATRVTGRLANATDSLFVIDVAEVSYVRGGVPAKWNGEEVRVPRDYVSGLSQRQLSKSRSWITAGVVVGALALASTIVIKGFGNDPASSKPPGGGPQTQ